MAPQINTPKATDNKAANQKIEIPSAPDLSQEKAPINAVCNSPPTYEAATRKNDTDDKVIETNKTTNPPQEILQQPAMMNQMNQMMMMQQQQMQQMQQMPNNGMILQNYNSNMHQIPMANMAYQVPSAQPIIMQQPTAPPQTKNENQVINVNVNNAGGNGVKFPTSKNAKYGRKSKALQCQHCNANIHTKVEYESSCGTLLCSGLLLAIGCFLCVCVPCCVDDLRTAKHSCPTCKRFLGKDEFIC